VKLNIKIFVIIYLMLEMYYLFVFQKKNIYMKLDIKIFVIIYVKLNIKISFKLYIIFILNFNIHYDRYYINTIFE
jgi:hypothetical protein